MFNQKVNGYISENPEYLNYSYSGPKFNPRDIHTCGSTINKYTRSKNCSNLPLQTWCSPYTAVESFGMRPITNPGEYFENIKKYLGTIIYTDSVPLKESGITADSYYLFTDYGNEPESSFIQLIKSELIDKLSYYMSESSSQIGIFKETNPICEGLIVTDVDIVLYRSQQNPNHFYSNILFSVFNTTRYNTISFKANAYQDTTPIMGQWNSAINAVQNSKNTPTDINSHTLIYFSLIDLLNNSSCVTGQESDCEFQGYNLKSSFSQLLNENFLKASTDLYWTQPNAITQDTYSLNGNYDTEGQIRIVDYGPDNLDQLIKNLT